MLTQASRAVSVKNGVNYCRIACTQHARAWMKNNLLHDLLQLHRGNSQSQIQCSWFHTT